MFRALDRHHAMTVSVGKAQIEITGSSPQYQWHVSLSAQRKAGVVEVKILDHLVVEFTPVEARDFARALLQVASD